jgi:hypothetical protein
MAEPFWSITNSHAWENDREKLQHCLESERDESRLAGAYREFLEHTCGWNHLSFDQWYEKQREELRKRG